MKKSHHIKLSLLSFLTFSLLVSCGPGKTVVKEVKTNQENVVEVITPCVGDKFQSNDKYFRGTANGSSVNMNMAKKIALRSANTSHRLLMIILVKQQAELIQTSEKNFKIQQRVLLMK